MTSEVAVSAQENQVIEIVIRLVVIQVMYNKGTASPFLLASTANVANTPIPFPDQRLQGISKLTLVVPDPALPLRKHLRALAQGCQRVWVGLCTSRLKLSRVAHAMSAAGTA